MHSRSIIRCHNADGGDGVMINLVIGTRDDLNARHAKVSARNATSNSTFFTVWCGCPRPAIVRVVRWHPIDLWRRPEPRRWFARRVYNRALSLPSALSKSFTVSALDKPSGHAFQSQLDLAVFLPEIRSEPRNLADLPEHFRHAAVDRLLCFVVFLGAGAEVAGVERNVDKKLSNVAEW
jgi:hypothetical protein